MVLWDGWCQGGGGVVKDHLELFRKFICFGCTNRPFVKMRSIYTNCNLWYTTNKIDMLLLFLCSNHTTVRLSLQEKHLAALPLSSILRQATTVALTLSCRLPQVWARKTERDRPKPAGHRGTVIFGHPLQTGSATWKFLSDTRKQMVSAF